MKGHEQCFVYIYFFFSDGASNGVLEITSLPIMLECTICCEEVRIQTLQCGHTFHDGCIKKWLARCRTCPNCRQSATSEPSSPEPQSHQPPSSSDTQSPGTAPLSSRLALLLCRPKGRLRANLLELYHCFIFTSCSLLMLLAAAVALTMYVLSTVLAIVFVNSSIFRFFNFLMFKIVHAMYCWERVPYFYKANDKRRYILSKFLRVNPILVLYEFSMSTVFMLITPMKLVYSFLNVLYILTLITLVIYHFDTISCIAYVAINYIQIVQSFLFSCFYFVTMFCEHIL